MAMAEEGALGPEAVPDIRTCPAGTAEPRPRWKPGGKSREPHRRSVSDAHTEMASMATVANLTEGVAACGANPKMFDLCPDPSVLTPIQGVRISSGG